MNSIFGMYLICNRTLLRTLLKVKIEKLNSQCEHGVRLPMEQNAASHQGLCFLLIKHILRNGGQYKILYESGPISLR